MFALAFILAHFIGDYVLQNNWIANKKTSDPLVAFLHGILYTVPYFFVLTYFYPDASAESFFYTFVVFVFTHAVIDHYRLAKYYIWAFNQWVPKGEGYSWSEAKANSGYRKDTPVWLSSWLMFIVDNTFHLVIGLLAVLIFLV